MDNLSHSSARGYGQDNGCHLQLCDGSQTHACGTSAMAADRLAGDIRGRCARSGPEQMANCEMLMLYMNKLELHDWIATIRFSSSFPLRTHPRITRHTKGSGIQRQRE